MSMPVPSASGTTPVPTRGGAAHEYQQTDEDFEARPAPAVQDQRLAGSGTEDQRSEICEQS